MATIAELDPVLVSNADLTGIRELDACFSAGIPVSFIREDGVPLPLPGSVAGLLAQVVHELAHGHAVSITPIRAELTTQQAADLLNVSRPFLIKLLETGEIPFHRVGSHRRVRSQDVLAYRRRRDQERRLALAEMLREAQEAGLYDNDYPGEGVDGEQGVR